MSIELTRTIEIEGFSLAWDEWGTGEGAPLALVHGFSGSAHDFSLVIPALAEHRRVLAIDLRGHGLSEKSHDEATYTIDHLVDDLVAWLSVVADRPVDLLGHSMGGRVALCLAVTRRDLLHSMILMDTTAWEFGPVDPGERAVLTAWLSSIDGDSPMGVVPESVETRLIAAIAPPTWQHRKAELSAGFDPTARRAFGLALFGDALAPVDHLLGDIATPTTVIAGEHDHPYVDHVLALAGGLVDARSVIIGGAYHSPQLTHTGEWLAAVTAHLSWVG